MSDTAELIATKVNKLIDDGIFSKAHICREAGFSKSQLDGYLKGNTIPTVDAVDRLAKAVEQKPWELIRPPEPGLQEVPIPGLAELVQALKNLDQGKAAQHVLTFMEIIDPALRERFLKSQERAKKGADVSSS
jgi:transcriptional regulator with XRE-family HTH domain